MSERKITALIVDDEALGRDLLRHMLRPHADIHVVAECADGEKALAAIKRHRPALVFLDVQMPKLNGLALSQKLNVAGGPVMVFVTAYDAYAIKAFEAEALDYLLKPFDQDRFDRMLERVRRRLVQLDEARLGENLRSFFAARASGADSSLSTGERVATGPVFDERIAIKESGRVLFVAVAEITWLEASGNYVALHTKTGKTHLIHETMTAMEARLDPGVFLRVHRSTIVCIARIKQLEPHFNGEFVVVLDDGSKLKLSRSYLENARHALKLH